MPNSNEDAKRVMDEGDDLYPVGVVEGGALDKEEFPEGSARGEAEEEETREVSAPPIPATPTREEVERHRRTHRPFRSWCPHCVRGKGRADRHMASGQKGVESGIPKLASDYFFIWQKRPQGGVEREAEEAAAEREG